MPIAASSATAARDGVHKALQLLQQGSTRALIGSKQVVRYLLAFTDGEDNRSAHSVSSLKAYLASSNLSNFNFVTIAAGLDAVGSSHRCALGHSSCPAQFSFWACWTVYKHLHLHPI